jgi:hypothetical protein
MKKVLFLSIVSTLFLQLSSASAVSAQSKSWWIEQLVQLMGFMPDSSGQRVQQQLSEAGTQQLQFNQSAQQSAQKFEQQYQY